MIKFIPNILSVYRIAAAPLLLMLTLYGEMTLFSWFLLASLISDILDGLIARAFHLQSELGARLDSIGDMMTYLVTLSAIYVFQKTFISNHSIGIALVLGFYILQVLIALFKFHKITSFHTTLARITAYMQGIFILLLFFYGFQSWMFYPSVLVSLLSYSEEIVLTIMLPEPQSNVGGLLRVLKNRSN